MQIFREPRITLLARQEFMGAPHIQWRSDTDVPAQALAEFAGRLCYLSFGADAGFEGGHKLIAGRTSNADYLSNVLGVKHGSVIEHAVWTFLFEGVSRALSHELVRHRHLSFSQLSQRYVDESEVAFVLPPEIREGTPAYDVWHRACARANDDYRELLGLVVVGPHATELIEVGRVAIDAESTIETLSLGMTAHPTLSEAIKEAGLVALGRPVHVASKRKAR